MADLTGLILAGGLGTRMRPLTETIPKCLIDAGGRPFLDWQLELLSKNSVEKVVLSTGHLGHMIEDHLKENGTHGIDVKVSHEKELLGTGGATIHALPGLPDEFFLMYGDAYPLQKFAPVHDAFERSGRLSMMTVIKQAGGTSENNCSIGGGLVKQYAKKQPAGTFDYMDYGLLFFRKKALMQYAEGNFATDRIFSDMIGKNELAAFETREKCYEIGSPEGLRAFIGYIDRVGGKHDNLQNSP